MATVDIDRRDPCDWHRLETKLEYSGVKNKAVRSGGINHIFYILCWSRESNLPVRAHSCELFGDCIAEFDLGPPVMVFDCCGGGPPTMKETARVVLRGSQTKMQSVERLTWKKYFRAA